MAMLAPRHEVVAPLPRAYRTPLHLVTAFGRLAELTRFLNWLTEQGVPGLSDIDSDRCEAYLAHRRYLLDQHDVVVGERSPATRRAAVQSVVDLVNHRDVYSADRVDADLRPWGGAAASAIAQMPCGRGQNKTPPVSDVVLQPLLATAGYLADTLGPHAVGVTQQVKDADRKWSRNSGDHVPTARLPTAEFAQLLGHYERDGEPLPLLADHHVRDRLAAVWSPQDPLARSLWVCWPARPGSPSSGPAGSRTCARRSKRPCASWQQPHRSPAARCPSHARTATMWNGSRHSSAFRQRSATTVAIHSAASALTSVIWAQRCAPRESKNFASVVLSRPGRAHSNTPVS